MRYIRNKLGLFEVVEPDKLYNSSFETAEDAELSYYKEQEFLINDKIRKHRENITKAEKELQKLDNSFNYLREIFPHEFL